MEWSFRPLAGIMVLIAVTLKQIESIVRKFPSPCGDYGSYPGPIFQMKFFGSWRFRPLAGIMVLILKEAFSDIVEAAYSFRPLAGIMVLIECGLPAYLYTPTVSVPLRGLWFLSSWELRQKPEARTRFRPLAGIMVLITSQALQVC